MDERKLTMYEREFAMDERECAMDEREFTMDERKFTMDERKLVYDLIQHHIYEWEFKDVYLCEPLLTTCIDGPQFVMDSKYEWTFQLGQYTVSNSDGICLFIKQNAAYKDVLVNFRVSVRDVREQCMYVNTLFDRQYRFVFGKGSIWRSPVIIKNQDFQQNFEVFPCLYWEICVELMYNEETEPRNFPPTTPELDDKRQIGTDLEKYCLSGQFSDTFIKIGTEEVRVHKAILHARCDYFCKLLRCQETEDGLSSLKIDPDVMKCIFIYLYTGDILCLANTGSLPLGIYEWAKLMKLSVLERFTKPSKVSGRTGMPSFTDDVEFDFEQFDETIRSNPTMNQEFSGYMDAYTLLFSIPPDSSPPHLSVFVKFVYGEERFTLLKVSLMSRSKKVILAKEQRGRLKVGDCLGFEKFITMKELFENEECIDKGTLHFIFYVTRLDGIVETRTLHFHTKDLISEDIYFETQKGYSMLSRNLGTLLNDPVFSDCTVVVGGTSFSVHKVILAARSPYFSEKLCVNGTSVNEIIVDEDVTSVQMRIVLDEIYTASVTITNWEAASQMYPLAELFVLPSLRRKCLLQPKIAILTESFALDSM